MDHEYNLATWLRRHPHLAAEMERPAGFQIPDLAFPLFFPRGDYSVRGCPSKPENQAWMAEGISWLAETFEVGGINIEAGDYGVCGCRDCQARRAAREDARRREGYAESWSHADMADFYPRLFEAARAHRPDAWIYSEIQWDNLLDADAQAPLRALPDDGIYQHTMNRGYWERIRDEMTADYARTLPTSNNVFRTQFDCQWNGDQRTERYRFNGRDFAALARKAAEVGFRGLTVWGEPSPYETSSELSYLAFARFTWDPSLTWERFVAEEVQPRLGGAEAAERFLAITETLDGSATIDPADLDLRRRFDGHAAYAQSKLANVLTAVELARRLPGFAVNSLHPGVVNTKLLREGFGSGGSESLAEGARTSVALAVDPAFAGVSGKYFSALREARPSPLAGDADLCRRVYEASCAAVGVDPL
jgi:NAD(P)-dependent dehydrogenase (short-subunit alcohol dehydrogenase family)